MSSPPDNKQPDDSPTASSTGRRLLAQMRKAKISETLREEGFVTVADVAAQIGVSEMTIRRDLDELERDGQLTRTHGGAVSLSDVQSDVIDRDEPAFDSRLRRSRTGKERIAVAAAKFVHQRQTVALDVGTSTYLLAEQLVKMTDLKLFTNSLRIASLAAAKHCDVYVPGGPVRKIEQSIWGPAAIAQFEKFWFDVAFVGVSGITDKGLYDYSMEDYEMKRVYLTRSTKKILLCDSTKFHHMSLVQVCTLDELDVLITDSEPPADLAKALAEADVEVHVAPVA